MGTLKRKRRQKEPAAGAIGAGATARQIGAAAEQVGEVVSSPRPHSRSPSGMGLAAATGTPIGVEADAEKSSTFVPSRGSRLRPTPEVVSAAVENSRRLDIGHEVGLGAGDKADPNVAAAGGVSGPAAVLGASPAHRLPGGRAVSRLPRTNTERPSYRAQKPATGQIEPNSCLSATDRAVIAKLMAQPVIMTPIGALKPNPGHARVHSEAKIVALTAAVRRFKTITPLIVDAAGIIIDGHVKLEVARRLGLAEVPVVRLLHLSDAERRALSVAMGRFPEWAEWDEDQLRIELPAIVAEISDLGLEEIGFSTIAFDRLMLGGGASGPAGAEADPADELPPPDEIPIVSRSGDLWVLGRHRVLCGSALEQKSYDRLLGRSAVRLILSDPPYNVPVNGNITTRKGRFAEFRMASGEMQPAEFVRFLKTTFTLSSRVCADGAIAFWFMDWRHLREIQEAGDGVFSELKNIIVWAKPTPAMGTFYRSRHELILAYKVGKGKHVNNFELGQHGRLRSNVWEYPGMAGFGVGRDEALALHVTPKPVALLHDAILDCSHPGDLVLDAFGGSGSTLIAADRARRCARLIEIEPRFVDTIVKRFERFTGAVATLDGDGRSFDEIAALREDDASSRKGGC